jgi:NADH:ubiquinone oxidoreductase subunit 6 (subunit J)
MTIIIILSSAIGYTRNPIYALIYLIGTFVTVSMLLLSTGIEFLALLYIIVYVGAVMILFLFSIMMLDIKNIYNQPTVFQFSP